MKRLLLSAALASLALLPVAVEAAPAPETSAAAPVPAAKAAHAKSAAKTAKTKIAAKKPEATAPAPEETVEASATPEPSADQPPADQADAAQAPEAAAPPTEAEIKAAKEADKVPHFKSGHPQIDAFVVTHAKLNNVPEALVHRVIVRESKYNPELVGHCGCIGLMQIKLGTARALGYTGDAHGLRDPETNLKYGIKYLAGAYRAANGDLDRSVHYFAAGYYEAAKRQRLAMASPEIVPTASSRPARAAMAQAPLALIPKSLVPKPSKLVPIAAAPKTAAKKPAQVAATTVPAR